MKLKPLPGRPLPCPFCGKLPLVMIEGHREIFRIECVNPRCIAPMTKYAPDKNALIRAWNRRAPDKKAK